LHPGDELVIDIEEHPPTVPSSIRLERTVQADGTVTLVSNKVFKASGKTLGEFRQEVRHYCVPRLFKSVVIRGSLDFAAYHVDGEVRNPATLLWGGTTTLGMAIAAAGGFTPAANKKMVQLTRADGEQRIIDCTDNPRVIDDVKIWAGDYITVPRE
jgi:protein involved in polysaccharide export with SLBB domain